MSEEDRAFLIAFSRTESLMQQYESHISTKQNRKK